MTPAHTPAPALTEEQRKLIEEAIESAQDNCDNAYEAHPDGSCQYCGLVQRLRAAFLAPAAPCGPAPAVPSNAEIRAFLAFLDEARRLGALWCYNEACPKDAELDWDADLMRKAFSTLQPRAAADGLRQRVEALLAEWSQKPNWDVLWICEVIAKLRATIAPQAEAKKGEEGK